MWAVGMEAKSTWRQIKLVGRFRAQGSPHSSPATKPAVLVTASFARQATYLAQSCDIPPIHQFPSKKASCHHELDTPPSFFPSAVSDCDHSSPYHLTNFAVAVVGGEANSQPLLISTQHGRHWPFAADGTTTSRTFNNLATRHLLLCRPIQLRAWIPTWRMSGACLQTSPPPLRRSPPPFPPLTDGLKA